MPVIIPSYRDSVIVVPPTLLRNSGNISDVKLVRSTLDLRQSYAAILFILIGRGAQSAIRTTGVTFQARRMVTAGSSSIIHPNHIVKLSSLKNSESATIATGVAGTSQFTTSSTSPFVSGDIISIYNSPANLTDFEVVKVLRVQDTTVYIDSPLQFSHSGDVVYNATDVIAPFQISGGCIYEIIFDCLSETSICDYVVRCIAQVYDGDLPG